MQSGSFRGVEFPSMLLSPLPKGVKGVNCIECDRSRAVWDLQAIPGLAPVCSLCVLYKVPWENKSEEDITWLIGLVEASAGVFDKDELGRLIRCEDADRIVSSLVMTSKVVGLSRRSK